MFVDDLLMDEAVLSALGLASAVFGFAAWSSMRKGRPIDFELSSFLNAALAPGLVLLIVALKDEFTWPLPGSYNILFYDPLVFLGVSVLAWWLTLRSGQRFLYAGVLTAILGLLTIYYGSVGYSLGMTLEPSMMFALFALYGLTGLLSLPLGIAIDAYRMPGQRAKWVAWAALIFGILAVLSLIVNLVLIAPTVGAHLAHAP